MLVNLGTLEAEVQLSFYTLHFGCCLCVAFLRHVGANVNLGLHLLLCLYLLERVLTRLNLKLLRVGQRYADLLETMQCIELARHFLLLRQGSHLLLHKLRVQLSEMLL